MYVNTQWTCTFYTVAPTFVSLDRSRTYLAWPVNCAVGVFQLFMTH